MEHNQHHDHSMQQQPKPAVVKEMKPGHHQHHQPGTDGATQHEGMHNKHAGHHTQDFLKRFWVCLALTLPVLLLSEMIQHWAGFTIDFRGRNYLLLALGAVIYFYGGMPFLKGMVSEMSTLR